ncbi:MAG TPA: endonuclease/exonuclease/phosphatase family protein [Pyrinomonadaceae bacterium]|nr:endonuclease/exonuclease/phosphatase family protein [Pyrinomonadaceae bacterium]
MRKLLALAISLLLVSGFTTSASSRTKLRVMSYNIHVGVGMDKQLDLQRIANVINEQQPDLVGLQEVDRGVKRTQGIDEIAELARMTKMEFAFAHNLDYQGGQYGVAILSRFPILKTDHQLYKNKREAERRGMLRIEVKIGTRTVSFVTTHLDYQYEDGRVYEAEQMLEYLKPQPGPMILVGDFNVEPSGESYQLISKQFRDVWLETKTKEAGLSYPADKPVKRIDFIMFRPKERIRAKKAWTVNTLASDHVPVMAELELN